MDSQQRYWDAVADAKKFTHPLPTSWLRRLDPGARILDFGCGYGRISRELQGLGYLATVGLDFSPAMIARARTLAPELQFDLLESLPLSFDAGAFDAVLLIAVLTCVPDTADQDAILSEV